jgi:hypothetical protein
MLAIPAFRRETAASRSMLVSSMVSIGQANTLVVPEGQLDRRPQNAVGVDGLDRPRRRTLRKSNTMAAWTLMQPN